MINSSKKCIKSLENCLTIGINKSIITEIILDNPGIRFYHLLVPYCLRHLHYKYGVCASISGPKSGLTTAHVCAFWGYDDFLREQFKERINFNTQDEEGFTILHYLVERC